YSCVCCRLSWFFFFQAEDGIRDRNVTGVQTCALPILENHPLPWDIEITYLLDGEKVDPNALAGKGGSLEIQIETSANEKVDKTRSEERRVGKECRDRSGR